MLSQADWHSRYQQQAGWTAELRRYLFRQAGLEQAQRVIEVGCGTGAVLQDFARKPAPHIHGLDVDRPNLRAARQNAVFAKLVQGDGLKLPFRDRSFDLAYCHYLLLWVSSPETVAAEMVRVTRSGGFVLALAEPDYGGRVDYPAALEEAGRLQIKSLAIQGADTRIGRRLAAILRSAGCEQVRSGVLGASWEAVKADEEAGLEWNVLRSDLALLMSNQEIEHMRTGWKEAIQSGQHTMYVPTFYAWGRVPLTL